MIGSFWNLCRACPSMPIDKLHSEYRSTYTWHEYTGNQDQHTVVRRAPQAPLTKENAATKLQSAKPTEDDNTEGPSLEPPLPRRKKCPELAYRSHEFITSRAVDGGGIDAIDSNVVADKVREVAKVLPASQLSKAISRISTEYRLQFAWPRRQAALTNGEVKTDATADPTSRKSINMGGLRQGSIMAMPAPVHKKRPTVDHRRTGRDASQPSELEPLVTTVTTTTTTTRTTNGPIHDDHDEVDSTAVIKATTRERTVRIIEQPQPLQENKFRKGQERPFSASEVMELRRELKRLADEYKHRDWGGGISSEDEATLWKRVSNNHALNALSLARSATKEEKEKENTRKVAPEAPPTTTNIAAAGRPSSVQARLLADADMKPDNDKAIRRARKDLLIRHHLDRTTGVGDGALLPSPTREKLEPVMPRRREEQSEIQPRSKSSPKNSPRSARSQSVGPAVAERRSPKRHPQRPPSAAKEKDKDKPDGREKSSERERHPRPSSVSRWKTRDASSKARSRSESTNRVRKRPVTPSIKPFLATNAPPHRPAHHAKPFNANTNVSNHASSQINAKIRSDTAATAPQPNAPTAAVRPSSMSAGSSSSQRAQRTASKAPSVPLRHSQAGQAMSAEQPRVNGHLPHPPGSAVAVTSPAQQQPRAWIDDEPVVKSPPEPTRVKSPEQMIMRSPEPVNWTVPLDTGKTFTVTQNVREGEPPARAHSETRSWTTGGPGSTTPDLAGGNKLPEHKPPAQPTQLHHLHHQSQPHGQQQLSGYKSPESESVSLGSFCGTNGHKEQEEFSLGERDSPVATISKDELAQQARCLEDPVFEYESKAKLDDGVSGTTSSASATVPPPGEQLASADLMEKARNRFDKFWGKGPEQ